MCQEAQISEYASPSCESSQRCYISTDRSGNLPSVFINSIFHVFAYLYSSRVQAKASAPFQSEFSGGLFVYKSFLVFFFFFTVCNAS